MQLLSNIGLISRMKSTSWPAGGGSSAACSGVRAPKAARQHPSQRATASFEKERGMKSSNTRVRSNNKEKVRGQPALESPPPSDRTKKPPLEFRAHRPHGVLCRR